MSQEESLFANPKPEMVPHVRDYSKFLAMFKWGTIASFIIAAIVVLIIAN